MASDLIRVIQRIGTVVMTRWPRYIVRTFVAVAGLFPMFVVSPDAQVLRALSAQSDRAKAIRLVVMFDDQNRIVGDAELASIQQIIRTRLARLGLASIEVERDGATRGRFVVTLPAGADVGRAKLLIASQGRLELKPVAKGSAVPYQDKQSADAASASQEPQGAYEVRRFEELGPPRPYLDPPEWKSGSHAASHQWIKGWLVLEKKALIGVGDILKAEARRSINKGIIEDSFGGSQKLRDLYDIHVTFTSEAGARLAQWSARHVGDTLAIMVDDAVISAPVITGVIKDQAIIQGNFDRSTAENLAYVLESGALPGSLRVLSEQ